MQRIYIKAKKIVKVPKTIEQLNAEEFGLLLEKGWNEILSQEERNKIMND